MYVFFYNLDWDLIQFLEDPHQMESLWTWIILEHGR